MAAKKIIYTANLTSFRPVIWYGSPVINRYSLINSVLKNSLGDEYAEFVPEPIISSDKVVYLSNYISNPTEFTKLNSQNQEFIRVKLQEMITNVKRFAAGLKNSEDPHEKELGELLDFCVEVPSLDNVLVEDNKIILAGWGLSSEKSFKENFKLESKIQKPISPVVSNASNDTPQQSVTQSQETTTQAPPPPHSEPHVTEATPPPPPTPPAPPKATESRKNGLPPWLWFILGALLMLIIFLILRFCSDNKPEITDNQDTKEDIIKKILPDEPNIPPAIDTTKLVVDPDDPGKRKVFSDLVNIAVAKGVKMEDFALSLHEEFKDDLQIVFYDTAINLMQVQVSEGGYKEWINKLKQFTNVKLAFTDAVFETGKKPSADPDFSNTAKSWYFSEVQAFEAWDITEGDSSVIVAVCDNGFDVSHPELKGKIVNPYCVVSGKNKVSVPRSDDGDHGTHVAGTALGNSDNNLGVCGIAPKCRLMPIQIADEDGNMSSLCIVAGILYAIHHEAKVVNLSVGTYFDENVTSLPQNAQNELISNYYKDECVFWNDLFQFALDENVVLVLAAGNQNIMAGIDPFARTDKALIVAAYQKSSRPKADFSNFGKYSNICAPGVKIYSSVPGGRFDFMDGTSMASPVVTGAAALMRSKFPEISAKEIIKTLIETSKPLNSNPKIGGLLQIASALKHQGGETLNIPEDSKDMSFAVGKWKSTTSLVNSDNPSIGVSMYFDIQADGKGKIMYLETTGDKFTADLKISFEDGKLIIRQDKDAVAPGIEHDYDPCTYVCKQNAETGKADCTTHWDSEHSDTDFNMVKTDF
ncbi:MAG: S8 family serine peptidase [Bacteroidales bacterium]|nr:S8 family serine peptidase [Bacteroidales bacterium]